MKVKVLHAFADCLGEHKRGDVYEPHGADLPGLLDGKMVEPVGPAVERATRDGGEKRAKGAKPDAKAGEKRAKGAKPDAKAGEKGADATA